MPELKKELKPLSEWVRFELENTKLLDPPEIEFKMSPIYAFDTLDFIFSEGRSNIGNSILECIQEWNLEKDGKKIPLDKEAKQRNLRPLLSAKLKGEATMLGWKVYLYAINLDNFVKN